ncbi:VPS35 endosomal protein-sorting factor-like [Lineus longissimus]|uniref:VPS35 endosomal protein-sorting factor-like n=1 Tax=Lineus longissimus TaxID=88925 RepID=UPI002B4C4301
MATHEWISQQRNYEAERKREVLSREETNSHPLKAITVSESKSRKSIKSTTPSKSKNLANPLSLDSGFDGTDPLSQFAAQSDPLSQMARQMTIEEKDTRPRSSTNSSSSSEPDDFIEPWSSKRATILSKYTTSEKLSITTSFLSASDKERVVVKTTTTGTVTDKVKNRLEQLDDFEEGSVREMLNLSQQEYVTRIDELNQALITAWDLDQRVKSLKIAIQCAKVLSETTVIQFYPSKFVLITDILDTFGKLVYERIMCKSSYYPKGSHMAQQLPESFTPDQVPDSAKETCRNWFFKIASIRELVPRLYVEMAILKCCSFLAANEFSDALMRLSHMIKGIGDPLVAVYARCYLSRVGMKVAPKNRDYLMFMFNDFLISYPQLQSDSVQNILAVQKVEMPRYLTLYSPALDWLLQSIAHNASDRTLMDVLQKCKQQCNSALLLNSIMSAFKPEYIAERATQFTAQIKECEETGFPKHLLHRTLGLCLVMADPPEDQRLAVLNEVWKVIMKLKNPSDYITCAEVWIEYVVKHFSKREVNTVLADIIKHMSPDRAFEDHYPQLQSVVSKVLAHIHDFSALFALDKFLPFIDMFQKESVKVEVCKSIMEAFIKFQLDPTNDPVIMNALMFICKTMHDSVNALTLNDERNSIAKLISGFVTRISFGRDFEQQLSFFVEARASFTNLDAVLIQLIQNVNKLSIETRAVVNGNHTRKTAAFVRACAAYCFITIPSLQGVFTQLNLYLQTGKVAMFNQCLSQADAFYKASISLIPEVPKTMEIDGKQRNSEMLLAEYIRNFASTLLVVQDSPDQGVLYLIRGLLNILQNYTWDMNNDTKIRLYMDVLNLLSAMSQESYAYHVDNMDSNDAMYGSDPKFLNEIKKICTTLMEEVLTHLKTLESTEQLKRQSTIAFELFSHILAHGDIRNHDMFGLALNLWTLAQKHGLADTKQMVQTLDYVKSKGTKPDSKHYSDLASKMHLQSRA